jgi:hypothetical protein
LLSGPNQDDTVITWMSPSSVNDIFIRMDTTPVTEKTLEPQYGESYGICENPDHGPLELEEWEL